MKDGANYISIKGARTHNLKNITIDIPKNKLIVFTGVSGSGKSSLVMDTLFAEGQRRYAESLNSYARQFLMRMQKPEVDNIVNLSPAIAINQKISANNNARSTVGTLTEIYEYIKLLFAKVGKTYSPISHQQVIAHNATTIQDEILKLPEGTKVFITSPLAKTKDSKALLESLLQKGFVRIFCNHKIESIESALAETNVNLTKDAYVVIDRLIIKKFDEDELTRLVDSIESALYEGNHEMAFIVNETEIFTRSNRFEADGIEFVEPSLNLFSFNNSFGACTKCEGHGIAYGIDSSLIVLNQKKSIEGGAIQALERRELHGYKIAFLKVLNGFNIPLGKPLNDFSREEMQKFLIGGGGFAGLYDSIEEWDKLNTGTHYNLWSKYKRRTTCSACKGTRLRKEALYVRVENKTMRDIVNTPIDELYAWFCEIQLNEHDKKIATRILAEINARLKTLRNVGLGYLTLNRNAGTLSGGESQRIKLTLSLGSSLTESIYILDEPSIGLHPRDTENLIHVLQSLKEIGNTVIVIEHDEAMMQAADEIVDIGPLASYQGGEVVAQGTLKIILKNTKSLTGQYLSKKLQISRTVKTPDFANCIEIQNAYQHNLKNINVKIPLHCFCVIVGVSGSGKTTLVKHILYPYLKAFTESGTSPQIDYCDTIMVTKKSIDFVEMIDQNAIGRSSRSNPISYIGAFDIIRDLFARQPFSKQHSFYAGMFSYNVPGGRCESCEGEGEKTIEMQFLADVKIPCDECNGRRYKSSVLEAKYNGKNIADVLDLTVDEAIIFFEKEKKILPYLQALQDVGLGYVHLGQSSSTLSGGEAQRIKLAYYLLQGNAYGKCLFIFDEPTTGLHFHDIQKLLTSFDALLQKGHSIIVVEHHTDVIKNADWIIELGPEAGQQGGEIIFTGTPQQLAKDKKSPTAKYL